MGINSKKKHFTKLMVNPKRMFLIDALGALLTSFLLAIILAQLEHVFGMPRKVVYQLSGLAFVLFIYSISCHLFIKRNWKPYLLGIMGLNSIYILVSILLIIKNAITITALGFTYFILELTVIGLIVTIEYKSYKYQLNEKPK